MTPYILYGGTFTRALGPQMVLEEGGIPYELRVVDMDSQEHFGEAFRRMNPAGFVPALVTPEGHVLHEAAGLMLYLADRHGLDLVPAVSDPQRGILITKLFYFTNDVQPAFKRFYYPARYALRPEEVAGTKAKARETVFERLRVLEDWLAQNGPFHLGDCFSIADLYLALWTAYGFEAPADTARFFPAVGRVFKSVLARPKSGPLLQGLVDYMVVRRARQARGEIGGA